MGAASCSAVSCHGGTEMQAGSASAYTTWRTRDPHSRAYGVLENALSQQIAANLVRPDKEPIPPQRDSRCLDCHVRQDATSAREAPTYSLEDGVSCESCHGPAARWIDAHWSSWRDRAASDQERRELGMVLTTDLVVRATKCAGCHVGDARRRVDHDLIAAGHPRLLFEFSSYLANLPKHWDVAKEKRDTPDFEARAWAIGQVVSAVTALDRLGHVASQADGLRIKDQRGSTAVAPWPELSEYSCFACHHDLAEPSWLHGFQQSGEESGILRWNRGNVGMAELLTAGGDHEASGPLALLGREMVRDEPRAHEIERLAQTLSEPLRAWLARDANRFTTADLCSLVGRISRPSAASPHWDWEHLVQIYLAVASLDQGLADQGHVPSTKSKDALKTMAETLAFPRSYDSAKPFGGRAPEAFQKAVESFLGASGVK